MFAFHMTTEVALEFYRRARELGAITEEQRTHILLQMCQEGLIKTVFEGDMSHDEFVEVLGKHFKVTDIREKDNDGKTKGEADSGEAGTVGN